MYRSSVTKETVTARPDGRYNRWLSELLIIILLPCDFCMFIVNAKDFPRASFNGNQTSMTYLFYMTINENYPIVKEF